MRNSSRLITSLAVAALAVGACSKKSGSDDRAASSPASGPGADGEKNMPDRAKGQLSFASEQTKSGGQATDNRKVIRTGAIQLVVGDYATARAKLDALLAATGGYVDSTQVSHSQGSVSNATIVLRLPSDTFGSILPKLRELGNITGEITNAADITAQYVDISARLASS